MNAIEMLQLRKELEAQIRELDGRIKKLQMLEKMYDCSAIRFSVLQSSGEWSDCFTISGAPSVKVLKKAIFNILEEKHE